MQKLNFFIHCILLLTTSTFFASPQNNLSSIDADIVYVSPDQNECQPETRYLTYDGIINLLEEIESEEIEKKIFSRTIRTNQSISCPLG